MTTDEVIARIDRQMDLLANPDLSLALEKSKDAYADQIERSFAESVDPDGEEWEPIVYRAVPPPPLVLSGDLRDSVAADARGAVVGKMEMSTTGTALVSYAADQDQGGSYGSPRYVGDASVYATVYKRYITWFPGRPFIGFGEETLNKAVEFGEEELDRQMSEVWQ